jgi:hypothetical protein
MVGFPMSLVINEPVRIISTFVKKINTPTLSVQRRVATGRMYGVGPYVERYYNCSPHANQKIP